MPAVGIWDGSQWQPIQGLPGADGTDGATGPQGPQGDQGDQGIPGPSSVSSDAGNQSVLGSDSLIFTPEFAAGVYLPLAGGLMSGPIDMGGGGSRITNVPSVWGVDGGGLGLNGSEQAGDVVELGSQEGTFAQFGDNTIHMFRNLTMNDFSLLDVQSVNSNGELNLQGDLGIRMLSDLSMNNNDITQVNLVESEAWSIPTLTGGWVNFGSGEREARYRRDVTGRVQIEMTIKGGSTVANSQIFQMPVGYRPLQNVQLAGSSSNAYAQVKVLTNGQVLYRAGTNIDFEIMASFATD